MSSADYAQLLRTLCLVHASCPKWCLDDSGENTARGDCGGIPLRRAGMDALRDAGIQWPLDALWEVLRSPQRRELGVGIALIIVSFVTSLLPRRQNWNQ
jgi:hypothetical protein